MKMCKYFLIWLWVLKFVKKRGVRGLGRILTFQPSYDVRLMTGNGEGYSSVSSPIRHIVAVHEVTFVKRHNA